MSYREQTLDEWHTKGHPRNGVWCWLRLANGHITPAYWYNSGWTNGDCWQDSVVKTTHWVRIPKPLKPIHARKEKAKADKKLR